MPTTELAQLIATAEQLSPERSPAEAVELNQHILALDPTNAAAHVRLARAYQAQRKFAEAKAACQEALRLHPQIEWRGGGCSASPRSGATRQAQVVTPMADGTVCSSLMPIRSQSFEEA